MVVVLPTPLTPTTRITSGLRSTPRRRRRRVEQRRARASATTARSSAGLCTSRTACRHCSSSVCVAFTPTSELEQDLLDRAAARRRDRPPRSRHRAAGAPARRASSQSPVEPGGRAPARAAVRRGGRAAVAASVPVGWRAAHRSRRPTTIVTRATTSSYPCIEYTSAAGCAGREHRAGAAGVSPARVLRPATARHLLRSRRR